MESELLTKSALKNVRSISEKAKREENSAQVVKALLYLSKYALILEEDAQLNIVRDFEDEIKKSVFPTSNVLESYLANLYWQYFQQHRYQFYNRTRTDVITDSTDFRTWDLTTLFREITTHFERSLIQSEALQNIEVSEYEALLHQQADSEVYRPTLFDLLTHTALEFYQSDETLINRPADAFEVSNPMLLCEAAPFSEMDTTTEDKTSLQARALHHYQKLIRFHLQDKSPEALVDVDLHRLRFLYDNAVFENKEQLYEEVLQNSAAQYRGREVSALYRYEIARLYNQWADEYQPVSKKQYQWKRKEALGICKEALAAFPKSPGAKKCAVLKDRILARELQLMVEEHIPVNKPSKLLVRYKNHNGLRFTAYNITRRQLQILNDTYPAEKQRSFIEGLSIAKQWDSDLKNEGDYQTHSTEVLLPSLENGLYVILAIPRNGGTSFAFGHTQVTNMALLETRTPTHHYFQVVDRNNGHPLVHANIQFTYQENYDRSPLTKSFTTDEKGLVAIPLSGTPWTRIQTVVTHGQDKAHFGAYYIRRKPEVENLRAVNYTTFLFTDRSIYRPGQPLYYKGIALKKTEDTSVVASGISGVVVLNDVNGQNVGEQEFTTNEYGSFNGEFIIPNSGLSGIFSLQVRSKTTELRGYTNISVEEYKRPKFETSFKPVTDTYTVNDLISLKGTAMGYAGSTVSGARVVYRVKRAVLYPRWHYWGRPIDDSSPQEIAQGETTTGTVGDFEIVFKAIPDNKASRTGMPVFTYEVTADVTDINGETRSAITLVRVGYHTMTASLSAPDAIDKDDDGTKLTITTTNLNGQTVNATGTVRIFKLKAPDFVLRKRPWPAPDYKSFTREKFKELFPYEAFDKEHLTEHWKRGHLIWETPFNTENNNELALGNIKKWTSGAYLIELETKDQNGQVIKDMVQTTVQSTKDKQLADNRLFTIRADKLTYDTGDKVQLKLSSNMEDVIVTVFIEKDRKIVEKQLIHLSKNSKTISIPVGPADQGGFGINYSFPAFNAHYSGTVQIAVPYPSTDLKIEKVSFRDKLQPGTEETWSFNIRGPRGDKVAAEVLAGMYDASLDAFKGHSWDFNPLGRPPYSSYSQTQGQQSFGTRYFSAFDDDITSPGIFQQLYDSLDWFGLYLGYAGNRMVMKAAAPGVAMEVAPMDERSADSMPENDVAFATISSATEQENTETDGTDTGEGTSGGIQIRTNLKETAFFFPQLRTDSEGNVSFSFTTPEALTRWNFQLQAHTKNLESSVRTLQSVTQKDLMVIPNAPRFLREGDEIMFRAKIANLTKKKLSGNATLELFDAVSGKEVSSNILVNSINTGGNVVPKRENPGAGEKMFTVDALGNTQVTWRLKVPATLQAIQYKVIAKAGDYSDGEQNVLPVLTNRILVTETLPMWVGSDETRLYTLKKMKENISPTLKQHKLSLEVTSNPAWYAIQALPFLMEYPYECNEQLFAMYYANILASHIANSNPRIREVFDQWANSEAMLSNLEKNEELKSLLIQETPWLRDAVSETEQKKRVALLFNLNTLRSGQEQVLNKLKNSQMSSGAWAWFKGGRANRYITQHIITGLGHLKNLGVGREESEVKQMVNRAISYLDDEFVEEYQQIKKFSKDLTQDHLSPTQIHYLYMRSFFMDIPASNKVKEIEYYYLAQAGKYWVNKNIYSKGLLALTFYRKSEPTMARTILRSLKENSITSEESGMYWKENSSSWHWYQAPIETQALLIEAFAEIENEPKTIDKLKIWLLKNKQTNQWKTTKATTEAVYALLLEGNDWLAIDEAVQIRIGGEEIISSKLEHVQIEAGTGYFKTAWEPLEITPEMAEVEIRKKGAGIAWGALYWQYFEDLDKIIPAETPLQLKKKLFLKKNTATGEEISEITTNTDLAIGDLVRVRIELRADRPMEFVHMKDMRASGLEPVNVLSQYKWQDGLGYYESTKDASTNFFFDFLPKGVFVFEYDLRVNNAGNFSNGISTIQSMYAPEFSSHSAGVRVSVGREH